MALTRNFSTTATKGPTATSGSVDPSQAERLALLGIVGDGEHRPSDLGSPSSAVVGVTRTDQVTLADRSGHRQGVVHHPGAELAVRHVDTVVFAS